MESMSGDFSVMPVTDLLQWIELSEASGTIILTRHQVSRKVYVERGRIIFVSSAADGEKLGEYIQGVSGMNKELIIDALVQSREMNIPFTKRLLELAWFTEERLHEMISNHAVLILCNTVCWTDGYFEFTTDDLPSYVRNGAISLATADIVRRLFTSACEKGLQFGRKNFDYFYIIKQTS